MATVEQTQPSIEEREQIAAYARSIGLDPSVIVEDSFNAVPTDHGATHVWWTQFTWPGEKEPDYDPGLWRFTRNEYASGELPRTEYEMFPRDEVPPFEIRAGRRWVAPQWPTHPVAHKGDPLWTLAPTERTED